MHQLIEPMPSALCGKEKFDLYAIPNSSPDAPGLFVRTIECDPLHVTDKMNVIITEEFNRSWHLIALRHRVKN